MSWQSKISIDLDLDDYREQIGVYAEDFLDMFDPENGDVSALVSALKVENRTDEVFSALLEDDPTLAKYTHESAKTLVHTAMEEIVQIKQKYDNGLISLREFLRDLMVQQSRLVVVYTDYYKEKNNG